MYNSSIMSRYNNPKGYRWWELCGVCGHRYEDPNTDTCSECGFWDVDKSTEYQWETDATRKFHCPNHDDIRLFWAEPCPKCGFDIRDVGTHLDPSVKAHQKKLWVNRFKNFVLYLVIVVPILYFVFFGSE